MIGQGLEIAEHTIDAKEPLELARVVQLAERGRNPL
jgi:hypothetical protein